MKATTKTTRTNKPARINWESLIRSNKSGVRDFAEGSGLRSMVKKMRTKKAKSEGYRIERGFTAEAARRSAKRALKAIG